MNFKTILLTICISFFSNTAFSGSDHDHGHSHEPVTQQKAEQVADNIIQSLVSQGVIENSWSNLKAANTEQKNFGGQMEWVVSYKNAKVSDPQQRTLYIFLTLSGEYLAANYTGK